MFGPIPLTVGWIDDDQLEALEAALEAAVKSGKQLTAKQVETFDAPARAAVDEGKII
jgi:hypothetical protein